MGEGRFRCRLLFVKTPRQPRLHRLSGGEPGGERRDKGRPPPPLIASTVSVNIATCTPCSLRTELSRHLRRRRLRLARAPRASSSQPIAPRVRLRRRRRRRARRRSRDRE